MLIEARAVELSNGSEVAAHAREVSERRARLFSARRAPSPPCTIIPFIGDDAYSELLKSWAGDMRFPVDPMPAGERVCRVVAHHHEITYAELVGGSRRPEFVFPRHIAMYICIRMLGYSYPKTAHVVGRVDHGTVIHAVRKMAARIAADVILSAEVDGMIARAIGVSR